MTIYWALAAGAFIAMWLPMVVTVCGDAADGGGVLALAFIPLFTMGIAIFAAVWPLTIAVLIIYACFAIDWDFSR
ncbi:hypothetical protein FHT44_004948 [Mycolicibacterium sp. BK634]|uniref:hypothetical protein n=1 Tax=Mycolicibacterium sp. BK634 TaxID=2587099 RepID=UPI00160CF72D|nr:hypothetical protein [Mycolicibacterium sp. BK634]MBB3752436.1 hypothetical protein [Mycolicibacterium sp. BK634]